MTIIPSRAFDILVFLVLFGLGIDFTWSGLFYLKDKDTSRLPRLLGFRYIKMFEKAMENYKGNSKCVRVQFGKTAIGFYSFIGGLLMLILGLSIFFSAILNQ